MSGLGGHCEDLAFEPEGEGDLFRFSKDSWRDRGRIREETLLGTQVTHGCEGRGRGHPRTSGQ